MVDNKVNDEVFLRNIGFVADTVLVDPDYWLVTRNNTTKKTADAVTGQNVVQVYPNPVADRFYVYLRNFTSPVVAIRLHNMAGQLIYNKSFSLLNGSEYLEIPSAYLAAGQYIFTVVAGKKVVFVKKLVK
ncbi:MAG: T9SS type A sorting domain-containing protein [Chitinophagaceae bacterium]|nr:T9SS type A sorting domain-containing protein [Chitinophagaceae bacterium]